VVLDGHSRKGSADFAFRGTIPSGATLSFDNGFVKALNPSEVIWTVRLPAGKSVGVGRLQKPDGSVWILNIPIEVKRQPHDPAQAVLSFFPIENGLLHGLTTPGSQLWMEGETVAVDPTGEFRHPVTPQGLEWNVSFKVQPPGGDAKEFTKNLTCNAFLACSEDFLAKNKRWVPNRFRLFQFSALQGSGNSFSAGLSWNPQRRLGTWGMLQGDLSLFLLSGTRPTYLGLQYQILFSPLLTRSFGLSFGGGGQVGVRGQAAPVGSLELSWLPDKPLLSHIQAIFLAYSAVFAPPERAQELKVGVVFSL